MADYRLGPIARHTSSMRVIVAPGQGSQKPGFLSPWLANPSSLETLQRWSQLIDLDLVGHGSTSDADTIRDTQVAQPLIVAAGLLSGRALLARMDTADIAFAGHSVGEYTASALAGVLLDEDALRLVAIRGRAMAKAAALEPTGMAAILGADLDTLSPTLATLGLEPANVNGGGQVVAAGPRSGLEALRADPPEGLRVIMLEVAGAFHTRFMQPALSEVAEAAQLIEPRDPVFPLYSNRDGKRVSSGAAMLESLVAQITSPVRWDLCMESFVNDGASELIELAPSGALVGLAKRAMGGVTTRRLDLPEQLDALD